MFRFFKHFLIANLIVGLLLGSMLVVLPMLLWFISLDPDLGIVVTFVVAIIYGIVMLIVFFATFRFPQRYSKQDNEPSIQVVDRNWWGKPTKYLVSYNTVLPPESIVPLPKYAIQTMDNEDKDEHG